jgi:hypothetical protein
MLALKDKQKELSSARKNVFVLKRIKEMSHPWPQIITIIIIIKNKKIKQILIILKSLII